ncbi:FAD-binding protein [Marinimicrococcus flavescens]|uniref:FAD-binding protein n=1 Tax=Marinimicrococcus flavescens TaxID=3031815 RepID=A0AAP4D6U8_9PROT|nr:FAD-binding protein [Marinimicrococcus flavescens]
MDSGGELSPGSLAELEQLVAWAVAEERSLELAGRGSKQAMGRPVLADHVLDLSRLSGVDMYEPEELVMSAGAGTPLAEIEAVLAERGQELAFEPGDWGSLAGGERGRQSIGGVIACNLAGPRRMKAGAARDHFLGVQCVTGHGQAIKAGGRVVKNVTGYDVCKLLAGSWGTLAALSHVTFKVMPRAETSATLLLGGPDEAGLLAGLRAAMRTPCEVSGAAMLPATAAARSAVGAVAGAGRALGCIRLEGLTASVAYRLDALQRALAAPGTDMAVLEDEPSRTLWAEIRDVALLPRTGALWRLSVAPSRAGELADKLAALAPARLHDWSGGLVWLTPEDGTMDMRTALAGHGGHLTLVRAPLAMRAGVPVFEPQPPALRALTERVKKSFDPKGLLTPGRMYEGI